MQLLLAHAGPDDHPDAAHHDGPLDPLDAHEEDRRRGLRLDPELLDGLVDRPTQPGGPGEVDIAAHVVLDGTASRVGTDGVTVCGAAAGSDAEVSDDVTNRAGGAERSHSRASARRRGRLVRAARPDVRLYVHLTDHALRTGTGAARIEGEAPVTVSQVRDWLGGVDAHITVRPVLDPSTVGPVDGWEVPARTREALRLRQPAEVFPYGTAVGPQQDLDHTVPYRPMTAGGPPGQTRIANLGPLSRSHHRAKTHGRWQLRQPEPGHYLWRSPHGWIFHVTNTGTQPLGHSTFAHEVWAAATGVRTVDDKPPDRPS